MTLGRWVSDFCLLHERAKTGHLSAEEEATYRQGRDDLGATLLVAQRLALGGKAQTRVSIRVTQAHQVELDLGGPVPIKALTQDIAVGGLSTMVAAAPAKGTVTSFRLRLSRSAEPVHGKGTVVYVQPLEGSAKIALRFDDVSAEDRVRLEDAVFDAVVGQLRLLPRHV